MAKHAFKYYLHDTADTSERAEQILSELPVLAERLEENEEEWEFIEKMRYTPFYEVELDCEIDDETFEITIKGVR